MIDCFSTRIFRHGGYRTEMIRRSFKDVVIGLVVGYIFGVKAFNLKPAVLSVMVSATPSSVGFHRSQKHEIEL